MSDTIVAHATPVGESALSLIRVSGPSCCAIFENTLSIPHPIPRKAYLSNYINLQSEDIDQVIAIFYEDGKSFTGESMIEYSCHGNRIILNLILTDLIKRGARYAEPGEFTKRAFLSKKIDLTQAEAVAQLISSQSEKALKMAKRNLDGNLSSRIKSIQQNIIDEQARIEASIDFPEDDIEITSQSSRISLITDTQRDMADLIDAATRSTTLNEDFNVILLGSTNVGKSTLFNSLIGYDRAIVSEIPGTTTDYISKTINLNGRSINLIDTAGIRSSGKEIEMAGINKTKDLLEKAELILLVLDVSLPYPSEISEIFNGSNFDAPILIVENKMDLQRNIEDDLHPNNIGIIQTVANNDIGTKSLITKIESFIQNENEKNDIKFLINARQKDFLEKCKSSLDEAISLLISEQDELLALSELKKAIEFLGNIIGSVDNEDMLDSLFSNFCIGK